MIEHNFVLPDFQNSIVNLAATLSNFLGNQPQHPILPNLASKLDSKTKNIVYLVVDGMGDRILAKHLPPKSFLRSHQIQTVTSVFPSTTAAATTTLTSGLTSSEHGWFAWMLDFDGEVVELFRNTNYYTKELLANPNFIREKLPYDSFWQNAQTAHQTYTCFPMLIYKNSAQHNLTYTSLRQMLSKLHKICSQPDQKFIYAYLPDFDTLMHKYGPNARKVRNYLRRLDRKIAKLVRRTPDTTFIITADHGQTEVKGHAEIYRDQAIKACLEHDFAWDARATSFKIKPGFDQQFKQAFKKYEKDFVLLSADAVIKQGILGDFKKHSHLKKYLGDYLAIGTETGKLFLLKEPNPHKKLKRGTHSGMTPEEMYVPVIVAQGE